jgi:hypothetical protein
MPNLNFHLSLATLIPDFIYQFLSNDLIDQNIFTCFELEDVRDAVSKLKIEELKNINKFLMIENTSLENEQNEDFMEKLDNSLMEIDNEYYHRYTPGELRFIFEEIINNIDIIYDAFKNETGLNLTLNIGFKFKDNLEANMIIEFMNKYETFEHLENAFILPIENYFVSDNIIARVYFSYIQENFSKYENIFNQIFDIINLKHNKNDSLQN